MRVSSRYKDLDSVLDILKEQPGEDNRPLHNILQVKRENRPHYLSLVWQIPERVTNEMEHHFNIENSFKDWDDATYFLHRENLHLTFAEFGRISDSYDLAKIQAYRDRQIKIEGIVSLWKPITIGFSGPFIGKSGINFEISWPGKDISPVDSYLAELENEVDELKIKIKESRSVSLVRYLRVVEKEAVHRVQLTELHNQENSENLEGVLIAPSDIKLVLLDKVAESFHTI